MVFQNLIARNLLVERGAGRHEQSIQTVELDDFGHDRQTLISSKVDDHGLALLGDAPRGFEGLHGPGDADPVGSDQKAQVFMGHGELDHVSVLFDPAMLLGHIRQDTVETVFQT